MQIYYITFCWNREYFYDGYIMKKDDERIIGFTDDSIIAGDGKDINEVCQFRQIIQYDISAKDFIENDMYNGFSVMLHIDENSIVVQIKKDFKMTEENIISRINRTLKEFPQYIQDYFIEKYLAGD